MNWIPIWIFNSCTVEMEKFEMLEFLLGLQCIVHASGVLKNMHYFFSTT